MIAELVKNGYVEVREDSTYYCDVKGLSSHPLLMKKIARQMLCCMSDECELVCSVPLRGLPICSYLSVKYEIPMIIANSNKECESGIQISGRYTNKSKCIIVEDVITTGESVSNLIDRIKPYVDVIGVVSILNCEQGYECDVPVRSVFTMKEISDYMKN